MNQDHGAELTMAHLHPLDFSRAYHKKSVNSLRLQGSFKMMLKQPSRDTEFSRPFQNGDPVQLLDWKAYARTDQLIIREKKDDAGAPVAIIIDAVPSMHWPLPSDRIVDKQVPTKFEIAIRTAFHLAVSHARGGDIVKLWMFDDSSKKWLKSQNIRANQLISFFELLRSRHFTKELLAELFTIEQDKLEKTKFSYFISDCLDETFWQRVNIDQQTSCLIHILSQFEKNIEWLVDDIVYFDQSIGKKEYPGKTIFTGDEYNNQISNFISNCSAKMSLESGYYYQITDATPLEQYAQFLESGLAPIRAY